MYICYTLIVRNKQSAMLKANREQKEEGGMKEQVFELKPVIDSRASFYGKAQVIKEKDRITLRSYQTDVAYIENNKAVVNGHYS
jgi:hypothetical protein